MSFRHLIVFSLFLLSCKKKENNTYKKQFEDVLNIVKKQSIYTNDVDWDKITQNINDSIREFTSLQDKYIALEYTLSQLKDKHSFFLNPKSKNLFLNN